MDNNAFDFIFMFLGELKNLFRSIKRAFPHMFLLALKLCDWKREPFCLTSGNWKNGFGFAA